MQAWSRCYLLKAEPAEMWHNCHFQRFASKEIDSLGLRRNCMLIAGSYSLASQNLTMAKLI